MRRNCLHTLKGTWLLLLSVLLLISGLSFAQNTSISGLVRSEGVTASIPRASVLVKGTLRGTTTNLYGEFSIQVAPREVLMISYGSDRNLWK